MKDGGPPPLRSDEHPLGLPGLKRSMPREYRRVLTANKLYELVAKLVRILHARKIAWSVENPENSIFWLIPVILALLELEGVGFVTFQNCMWGSKRDKWTSFLHYPEGMLEVLRRVCDGMHEHLP